MKIKYKGKIIQIDKEFTVQELLKEEIEKSEHAKIGAIFNNEYINLGYKINKDGGKK